MIKLGDKVTDTITGFKGIVTAKAIYLNGCVQFQVQPKGLKDEEIIKSEWIDEGQLIVLRISATVDKEGNIIEDGPEEKPGPGGGFRNHPF